MPRITGWFLEDREAHFMFPETGLFFIPCAFIKAHGIAVKASI